MMKLRSHFGRSTRLLVAALFLVGYGEFALHFITTSHRICAEHSEIVEASHHPAHASPGDHFETEAPTALRDAAHDAPADAHEDGCHFLDLLKTRALEASPATTFIAAACEPALAWAAPADDRTPCIPLHLLAPSHSPPQV